MKAILEKYKKPLLIVTGLIVLYALIGFFAVPFAIKAKVPEMVQEMTGTEVTLDDAEFNPFSLTLSLKGFAMQKPEGNKIIGLGELYVNYGLWTTIKHLAVSIDEFRLTAPYTNIVIDKDGSINLANLLKTDETEVEESEQSDEIFQIWIKDIRIEQGQIDFANLSSPEPFKAQIQPINLHVEDFNTLEVMLTEDDSFVLDFDGGKLAWEGSLSLVPEIKSDGKITISNVKIVRLWEAIKDQVNFQVREGILGLEANYNFVMDDEISLLTLSNGQVELTDFGVSTKDSEQQLIKVPELLVKGISYDHLGRELTIEDVSSNKAYALTQINQEGQLNLITLYTGYVVHEVQETAEEFRPDDQPLLVNVNHIALNDYRVDFVHETNADPVRLNITPIDIDITGLSTKAGSEFKLIVDASVNKTGNISINGTVGLDPVEVAMDISAQQLALKAFQPYLDQSTKLKLVRGSVNLDNHLNLSLPRQGDMKLELTGNASINKLKTVAAINNKNFLTWHAVSLEKIKFTQSPLQLDIATIDVNQLTSRFIINKDKTTNVSHIFNAPGKAEKTKPTEPKESKTKQEPFALNINEINIRNSETMFADRSLIIPFAADIKSLNGAIKKISNNKKARSSIDLKGKVNRTAPVLISGSFEPFAIENYLDVKMQFLGISMTSFTPYMAQFAGYKIEKGKLTVELDYDIKQKKLQAENKVGINQLTLGEEVDSPDSVSLPIKLALGLLKDVDGNINLDLPVKGSLDDPEFSVWGLVGDALLNLLTKAVSAPFSLIAGIAGSDADLSKVNFNKGSFELQDEQQQNLKAISLGLQQRPQLQLEIRGVAFRDEDGQALAENEIIMQIKTEQWNDLDKDERPDRIEDVVLDDEDYHDSLIDIYEEKFSDRADILVDKAEDAPDAVTAKQIYAQMLQQLGENAPVTEIELKRLADQRASAILKFLTELDPGLSARMFLLNHEVKPSVEEGGLYIDLKLGAAD